MFVAVQDGRLLVVKNGVKLGTPFVTLPTDASGERGMLGVALPPSFASNGWVYVYYTRVNGSARNNRVSRFTASGDVASGGETVLVDLPTLSSATNHNGGAMHFGTDGKLYVAVGDNANTSKPQNLNDPFGKMLRFNDNGSIPSDNPFCTTAGNLACAVWAYGLRNPFTFAFQPGTGRMHINDVGQSTWEEVNLGARGANYGWPGSEGPANITSGITAPLFAYGHSETSPPGSGPGGFFFGVSIIGGAFYPSTGPFPAQYHGKYFFTDYLYRYIAVLDVANGNSAYVLANLSELPVGMLVGNDGALYVLGRDVIERLSYP
jgi:glucose/arabinose dehydrogenase